MERKQTERRVVLEDGTAINVSVLDGITTDDVLVQGAKAEGYRVMTGRDVFPTVDRRVKDFLIRIGVIS